MLLFDFMANQMEAIEGQKDENIVSSNEMTPQQGGGPMTFDQWIQEVSKTISFESEESQKSLSKIFELSDEDFEEDESPSS
jgi:hypothetical protein